MATLEWAHQQALIAADAVALVADDFRHIDPASYGQLVFSMHPACGLVRSSYPIVRIWRANQPETASDEVIDLASAADNVLVLRSAECVEFHRLADAPFALIEALARGESLGTALDRAHSIDSDFDLGAALRHVIGLQILTGLQAPTAST